jgi:hypothetical protein
MKKMTNILGMTVIVANAIIATSGSISYGCANNEHIYTVFGVLNFIGWAYVAYKWVKEKGLI